MKKSLLLISLFFLFLSAFSQQDSIKNDDYAIVQVLMPQTVFGDFQIKILYGNGKIEEFRTVKYSKDNRELVSNHVVDALNYMKSKGYKLKQAFTITQAMIETQYVFEKE